MSFLEAAQASASRMSASPLAVDDEGLHDSLAGLFQGGPLEDMQHAHDLAVHFGDDDPMTRHRRRALEAGAEFRLVRRVSQLPAGDGPSECRPAGHRE